MIKKNTNIHKKNDDTYDDKQQFRLWNMLKNTTHEILIQVKFY